MDFASHSGIMYNESDEFFKNDDFFTHVELLFMNSY